MKLLLYGGTFDPPHKGHIHLLEQAIRTVQPDKVVVMPAGIPPHKAASATPGSLRLEMCRCFLGCHPNLTVSSWEMEQQGKSYTVETLRMLREKYPDAQLYLSVGSDMLTSFTHWKQWQQILQMAVLVVQSRTPGDRQQLAGAAQELQQQGGQVLFTDAPALEVSSSEIRSGAAGEEYLPPEVLETAKKHHLYGR